MLTVHITLTAQARVSPQALQDSLSRIQSVAAMQGVNQRRLSRYGILSGQVAPDCLPRLQALPEVQAVDIDGLKRAL